MHWMPSGRITFFTLLLSEGESTPALIKATLVPLIDAGTFNTPSSGTFTQPLMQMVP